MVAQSNLELIEASAGTGKTYTICSKAAELVVQQGVAINQLLMVTFTNKAASEMQDRLRVFLTEIEADEQRPLEQRHHAASALANFDTAQITTFHGFCQAMMARYGFECLLPLNLAVENDPVWAQKLLLKQIRQIWIPMAESAVLFRAEMLAYVASLTGSRGSCCIQIASSMQSDDIVQPGNREVLMEMLQRSEEQWLAALTLELREFLADNWSGIATDAAVQFGKADKKGEISIETSLLQPLQYLKENIPSLSAEQTDQIITQIYNNIWRRVRATSQPLIIRLRDVLRALKGQLKPADIFKTRLCPSITAAVSSDLAEVMRQNRAERGVVSFNDMVQGFADALLNNDELCQLIAAQYQAALIDEFQDTDPLQWRIVSLLFLQNHAESRHLVLVGDPKQAIYTFRGANVQTYLAAKQRVLELGGKITSLDTNYRSAPEFIDAINQLCGDHKLFGEPQPGRLEYQAVQQPKQPGTVLCSGWDEHKPIVVVKTDVADKRGQMSYMQFIVEEIITLMDRRPMVQFRGQSPRNLQLDDICILCKSHHQAKRIGARLAEAGISYSNGRSSSIYQTAEAAQMLLVLQALLQPDDHSRLQNALLTRVFGLHPLDLLSRHAVMHAQRLMQRASDMAEHARWDRLFHVLCHQTELLQREISETDGDRRAANWLHLSQDLTSQALENHDDLAALVRRLQRQIDRGSDDEQSGQLRKEADQPKVQVVTMHASKGLEYGVVFLLTGQKDTSGDFRTLCYSDHTEFLCQSLPDDDAVKMANQQFAEEQQRLLYVAMTRARCRLYMPLLAKSTSAMSVCLTNMVTNRDLNLVQQIDYQRLGEGQKPFLNMAPSIHGYIAAYRPAPSSMRARQSWVHSFSNLPYELTKRRSSAPIGQADILLNESSFWQLASSQSDELIALRSDDDIGEPSLETELPTGPECGNLFHSVLQAVDFQMVRLCADSEQLSYDTEFRRMVIDAIPASGLPVQIGEPAWLPAFAARIWHTLNAICSLTGEPLGDLATQKRRAELPFHICADNHEGAIDDLYGIIDLVFEHDDKLYIVDWKSNTSASGYGDEALEELMEHGGYHGQYRTYILALQRLYQAWGMTEFWRRFGGICYVFLRGVEVTGCEGFYICTDITEQEIEQFESRLTTHFDLLRNAVT